MVPKRLVIGMALTACAIILLVWAFLPLNESRARGIAQREFEFFAMRREIDTRLFDGPKPPAAPVAAPYAFEWIHHSEEGDVTILVWVREDWERDITWIGNLDPLIGTRRR